MKTPGLLGSLELQEIGMGGLSKPRRGRKAKKNFPSRKPESPEQRAQDKAELLKAIHLLEDIFMIQQANKVQSHPAMTPEQELGVAQILGGRITPGQILHLALRETLWDWAHLDYVSMPNPTLTPAPECISLGVALSRPRVGMVAVSAPLGLGEALAVAATGDPSARSFGREALAEFCQRVRERLEGGRARTMHSPPCVEIKPEHWPEHEARASVCVLIQGHLLELRQWEP